jgi:hypothetical protein
MVSIIFIVVVLIFVAYQAFKHWQRQKPENVINRLESLAYLNFEKVRSQLGKDMARSENTSPELNKMRFHVEYIEGMKKEIYVMNQMESNYLRLKERNKHNIEQRVNIVQDWFDYCAILNQLYLSAQYLSVTGEHEYYKETTKGDFIKKEEIEKRFRVLLEK